MLLKTTPETPIPGCFPVSINRRLQVDGWLPNWYRTPHFYFLPKLGAALDFFFFGGVPTLMLLRAVSTEPSLVPESHEVCDLKKKKKKKKGLIRFQHSRISRYPTQA